MKVSYPLSLKVSLWLMLNLLLLAGLALGFLVMNGGLRWDALVAGPSGDRMQNLANVIAGEVAAATGDARTAVLKRFGTAYRADFYLFNLEDGQIAGPAVDLPADVRTRMEFRAPRMGPFGDRKGFGRGDGTRGGELERSRWREGAGKGAGDGSRPSLEADDATPHEHDRGDKGRGGADFGRREPPPGMFGPPGMMGTREPQNARFIVRAGSPSAYWLALRVPYQAAERGRPFPARLVVRVGSLWSLLHLLNLQSWVIAGTAVLALSVLFWLPLVRGITKSVGQLTTATEQIAEGRFDTRVRAERRDELGKLGESVNRMAARLDAHMSGQKRFLGDVAHELCSPLARLQMATGILAEQAPSQMKETVEDVRDEVQQVSTLVNELLAFTKAGLQPREAALAPVDLAPLLGEVLTREAAGDRVTLHVPAEIRVKANADLLARALANLVRNALRYAGEAGPISVSAAREDGRVAIAVEDLGPGVPPADIDRLGEPFFRPELARTREAGGVGLGLAIVRSTIASCGGEVRFSNRTPHGFRAEIRLAAA